MALPSIVKILEKCNISPPPGSAPPTTLPLTFFDIPWLFFSPSQPLFFYEFPYSTPHFTTTTLKHSLSLTLQHFHPLAGTLSIPPPPSKPQIVCAEGDFVSLTIAESSADFNHLSGNHPRDVTEFYSLVPELPSIVSPNMYVLPLLAVQITIFPESGICIGLALHNVAGDERTFNIFMKSWALICKSLMGNTGAAGHRPTASPMINDHEFMWDPCVKPEPSTTGEVAGHFLATHLSERISIRNLLVSVKSLPSYDRTVIIDPNGLETTFLKEWWNRITFQKVARTNASLTHDMVRATFVLSPTQMAKIKQRIIAQCKKRNQSQPLLLSPYVVTCAFIWVCLIKAQAGKTHLPHEPIYLGFIAGGITRLNYHVPPTYFGNCIAFGRSMAEGSELVEEDGVVAAAKAIGRTIKELDGEVLGGAERWISEWEVLFGSDLHLMVVGSPKVDLYEMDFGWGRPKKIEKISIDGRKAISLTESRDLKGGIEVGVVLPKGKIGILTSIFNAGLNAWST